ncbi:MAG TPA: hypothetical protein VF756_31420 [Thermoanaerobaculia bacterium]
MEVPGVRDLVKQTLAGRPWVVLLDFKPSDDEEGDWSLLWPALRGLGHESIASLIRNLREHGLGAVVCGSEEEARRLFAGVRTFRVGLEVFDGEGRRVSWERPDPRRRRTRGGLRRKGERPCLT